MQFDFGLDLVSHFVVIGAVTLALVIMCLVLYSELDATNSTSLFYYREASARYLVNRHGVVNNIKEISDKELRPEYNITNLFLNGHFNEYMCYDKI